MIIPRQYEWLGELYNKDKNAKAIIDEAFKNANYTHEQKNEIIRYNNYNIPAFFNIGSGFPGQSYKFLINEFDLLDKKDPYDNGLSFNDVTNIEFETSRKGTAIQMRFVQQIADYPYRIVGFASVENKDNHYAIGEGWRMKDPFTIG